MSEEPKKTARVQAGEEAVETVNEKDPDGSAGFDENSIPWL